jgi:hypothetical protein
MELPVISLNMKSASNTRKPPNTELGIKDFLSGLMILLRKLATIIAVRRIVSVIIKDHMLISQKFIPVDIYALL